MTTERIIRPALARSTIFSDTRQNVSPLPANPPAGGLPLLYYICTMLKTTLIKAAERAGGILKQYYGSAFRISNKEGVNNLVTEADHAAEKAIMEIIRNDYPDHYILSEESGDMPTASAYKWIIDPLDGTVNFAHGLPICCVSIGLEQEGDMLMGAVYNPFFNEFYFAQKGIRCHVK